VRADPGQLSQVLLNLIFNARDAMPDGGVLTVETAETMLDHTAGPVAPGEPALQGGYAILTVSDTGHGMNRETASRIFEPFFTTKPVGEGTGLGLSTVHGIVRQSNGSISVESAPGWGTTFKIYLPQTMADLQPPVSPSPASRHPTSGTILVVDDQSQVRAMLVRALQEEGYTVLAAASAREALVIAMRDGARLDLMITDLLMPDMTGGDLAKQVQASYPSLAVLFTSGHPDEEMRQRGLLGAEQSFLPKPYSPEVLAAYVRQLLEQRRQG
jgi:CheY-like chemotaxis protein